MAYANRKCLDRFRKGPFSIGTFQTLRIYVVCTLTGDLLTFIFMSHVVFCVLQVIDEICWFRVVAWVSGNAAGAMTAIDL